jgi:hypothetical protein
MGGPFYERGGKMRIPPEYERNLSAELIHAIGGEPLDSSGFETEEPNPGFSSAELSEKE